MDKRYKYWIALLSVAVPALVAYLIYKPLTLDGETTWTLILPHINAAINGTTSVLLLLGLYFIKMKMVVYHRATMISAFFLGCLFLVSYIIYHSTVPSTSFGG